MHLLIIDMYELGQFLRILLWIFLPLFVIVLLITTYIHHRRKRGVAEVVLENRELLLSVEGGPDLEQPEGDDIYKGLLWMKQKFEEYRVQADVRVGGLREQLEQRNATIQALQEELAESKEKIADLKGKLENNMSLLLHIHKELDRSLGFEKPLTASTPEAG